MTAQMLFLAMIVAAFATFIGSLASVYIWVQLKPASDTRATAKVRAPRANAVAARVGLT
jgi:hypothetical protein